MNENTYATNKKSYMLSDSERDLILAALYLIRGAVWRSEIQLNGGDEARKETYDNYTKLVERFETENLNSL